MEGSALCSSENVGFYCYIEVGELLLMVGKQRFFFFFFFAQIFIWIYSCNINKYVYI